MIGSKGYVVQHLLTGGTLPHDEHRQGFAQERALLHLHVDEPRLHLRRQLRCAQDC